jgi:hypothetical protein
MSRNSFSVSTDCHVPVLPVANTIWSGRNSRYLYISTGGLTKKKKSPSRKSKQDVSRLKVWKVTATLIRSVCQTRGPLLHKQCLEHKLKSAVPRTSKGIFITIWRRNSRLLQNLQRHSRANRITWFCSLCRQKRHWFWNAGPCGLLKSYWRTDSFQCLLFKQNPCRWR